MLMSDRLGIGKNASEGFEEVMPELRLGKLSKEDLIRSQGQDGILDKRIRMLHEYEFTLDNRHKLRLSQAATLNTIRFLTEQRQIKKLKQWGG